MKKTKIIFSIFTLIIIYFILSMFSKVEARYVKTASVDIDYNTSDYYFDIEVDKTEITSLPATINVTVKNYEGNKFTDTDLNYNIVAGQQYISLGGETTGMINGGSSQENTHKITIDKTAEIDHINNSIDLVFNIENPYTDTKKITINVKYKTDNIKIDVATGMIPVKYEENIGWVRTTENDPEWYNYNNKKWANVVLSDSTFITKGEYQVLDENKAYSMLVYIPRYAYKITNGWHSDEVGTIDIKFVNTNNEDFNGSIYNNTYEQAISGISSGEGMNNFVQHPAFTYGNNELNGIWVGKFETSNTKCTPNGTTGQAEYTGNEVIMIKAGVTSWRNLSVSNAFDSSLKMNNNSIYGLSNDDNKVDPHLTKNSEWGAVTYLTKSIYGKNEKVWKNNSGNYITGSAGSSEMADKNVGITNDYTSSQGVEASTTGNVYGIYDMSGGAGEYVASYVNNGNENIELNGKSLVIAETKYVDKYESITTTGANVKKQDYELSKNKYGDAIYETSANGVNGNTAVDSWYSECADFPATEWPFFMRSGAISNGNTGLFYFNDHTGANYVSMGFRITIPVIP